MTAFTPPLSLRAAFERARAALAVSSATASLDAEVLVRQAGGATRAELMTHPERPLSAPACAELARLVARRRRGEPVAYIAGRREFWSLDLQVSPATLIPRPETELLVERALARIPSSGAWSVADLGTGSGAVALAIAHERPAARVVATDCSETALAVARANARRLGLLRVEFCSGSWLAPLHGRRLHMIVSNPPYVRADDAHLLTGDVRFEPRTALVGGADGLEAIRQIVAAAPAHLSRAGWLLLEHGFDQGADVRALLAGAAYRDIRTYRDLAGNDRVTEAAAP